MTNEYFETGYLDDEIDEMDRELLEDEMPDEPNYIAEGHENWDGLLAAEESARYDEWVETRFVSRSEQLIREHDALIRAINAIAPSCGYSTSGLMYMACEDFGFPILQRTLSGLDDEALQKMLAQLQTELAAKADRLALRMATANLAPLEARKAS